MIGTIEFADVLVAQQPAEQADKGHDRGHVAPSAAALAGIRRRTPGRESAAGRHVPDGPAAKPPRACAAFEQILHLRRIGGGAVERGLVDVFVGDGHAEAGAKVPQFLLVHFLLLVGDVASFAGFAESVALDGLGQNHRRGALVADRGLVGGIDLFHVMAAAIELAQLLVG